MRGTMLLTRLAWRQDRVLIAVWTLALVGFCYASAAATPSLYASAAERAQAAEGINASPAVVALYGPILDVQSTGELSMAKATVLYAVFVALLGMILVRRHTRTDEESGRTELVSAGVVGPHAPLAAAFAAATGVFVLLGALVALADIAGGLAVRGSLVFGLSWTLLGLVGAALTLVAAQLVPSARTCAALAGGMIGVLYLFRAIGDTSAVALNWLSPFGWATQLRAWSGTRWWVLALYVAFVVGLVALAHTLRGQRDLGAGLVTARRGPAAGAPYLASSLGLALRLHRGMLVGWTIALMGMGALMGAIAPSVSGLLTGQAAQEMIRRLGGPGSLERTLIAAEASIGALVVTVFAISVVSHASHDEQAGLAERTLSSGATRASLFAGTLAVAAGGALWLCLATGLGVAAGYRHDVVAVVFSVLASAPAVWVVIGIGALGWALRPGWYVAGWVALAASLVADQIAQLLDLPTWVGGISPYSHLALVPSESFRALPALVLVLIAAAIGAAAWLCYRHRDVG